MYKSALGLQEAPFGVTPDPKFVYLSARYRNALAGLTYGILGRKRFILLTGDVGTGKTTLIRTAIKHLPLSRTRVSLILNSTLTAQEVLEATLSSFGLTEIPPSKVERLTLLEGLLKADERHGRTGTLIIDEAHKLGYDALEEIRLLGNLDSLQIVLAGQNELIELLDREELRAFKQRISLRLSVEPLSPTEVVQYIAHRWATAGGKLPAPFDSEALERIAQESRGIPRVINTLCDNALMAAFLDNRKITTRKDVLDASAELHLPNPKKLREMIFGMNRSGEHAALTSGK
jgi:general secretion pathway protein A